MQLSGIKPLGIPDFWTVTYHTLGILDGLTSELHLVDVELLVLDVAQLSIVHLSPP